MDPLVSIAVATYNGERFLEEQLDSIYAQTYKNIEVIVSDDLSNDKTIEILKKYKDLHGLIYYVNNKRLGVTKNFENAIKSCTGKYILLSDQDDVWLPEKIEYLLYNIGNASMIYSDGLIFKEGEPIFLNKISNEDWLKPYGIDSSNKDFFKYLLLNSFILGCSVMFDKAILNEAVPFYQSDFNHDWWLIVCAHNNNGVKYLDKVLFKYRIHTTNYSLTESRKRITMRTRLLSFYTNSHISKNEVKKIKLRRVLQKFNDNNDSFLKDMVAYSKSKSSIINITDFRIVYKYRKLFFPTTSRSLRAWAILTTLVK